MKTFIKKNQQIIFFLLITLSLSLLTYLNSLHGELLYDDILAIKMNPNVNTQSPLARIWTTDFWGYDFTPGQTIYSYRPLTTLSFRLNYLWGGLAPFSYHLVNVLLHSLATLLFFIFCYYVVFRNAYFALMSASLFAVHAVHTESVASIVGRADILGTVFFLLTLLAYVRSCRKNSLVFLALAILFSIAAMLSKEHSITALGCCGLYEIFIFRKNFFTSIFLWLKERINKKTKQELNFSGFKTSLTRLIFLSLSVFIILYYRSELHAGFAQVVKDKWANPVVFHPDFYVRFLTLNYFAAYHAFLLLFPLYLSHNYQFEAIPFISSIFDVRNLITLGVYLSLFFLIYLFFKKKIKKENKNIISWALIITLTSFLPLSNLFFKVAFVIAERVLYIPSLGFCLILPLFFLKANTYLIKKHPVFRKTPVIMLLFITVIAFHLLRTISRNEDWHSIKNLVVADLKTVPLNTSVMHQVALVEDSLGNYDRADELYRKSSESPFARDFTLHDYAKFLTRQNRLKDSIEWFEKAIKAKPRLFEALIKITRNLIQLKDKALQTSNVDLANSYHEKASYYLRRVERLAPRNRQVLALKASLEIY